jgi:hypothetical protein
VSSSRALTAPSRAGPPAVVVNEHQRTVEPSCAVLVGTRPWGCKQTEVISLSKTNGAPSPQEVAAVLSALAGMRKGDPVAAVAAGRITQACLAAGAARDLLPDDAEDASARVVVVEDPADLAAGLRLLAPGGRLVSVAPDARTAEQEATDLGLSLRHVERLGSGVAWSAVRPLEP